jgi:hypothetical protein
MIPFRRPQACKIGQGGPVDGLRAKAPETAYGPVYGFVYGGPGPLGGSQFL